MITNIERSRRVSEVDLLAIKASLPDLGESIWTSAVDLAHGCTLQRLDNLLAQIKGAETNLIHLRKGLAPGGSLDGVF